ncbi:MAG: PH domain-containing protein, partial [Thermomicrobiales bacterium]|nr:PH domain-containing protein [Thermomicrobiales bacterium]
MTEPAASAPSADRVPAAPPDLPPRRQHPAFIAISLVRHLRGLAIPALLIVIGRGQRGAASNLAIVAALAVVAIAWQAAAWWFTRYAIVDGRVQVASGVLSRQERLVPVERVQGVDITETPLQRIFGVVGVRIETAAAGGGESDVILRAVTRREADAIRARLLRSARIATPAAAGVAAPAAGEGVLLRRITPTELLLTGATSGRVGPALALVTFAVRFLDELLPQPLWRRLVDVTPGLGGRGLVAALLAAAVVAWLLAI